MATGRLKAGVAELEITCPVGLELAAELNPRTSQGVRSPLMAKALVLSDGEETLALLTLDLFGLQHESAEALSQAVVERAHLKPEALMVVSSHTRGGPYTTPVVGFEGVASEYLADLVQRVPVVVEEALSNLQEASLGVGRAILPHLLYNHRLMTRNYKAISAWLGVPANEVLEPEGPVDPDLTVFAIRDGRGRPICLLWNIAADNRFAQDSLISADLPYAVQRELDARIGRHVPTLCVTGCAGNVSYRLGLGETADAVASGVMAVQLETPCDPAIRLGAAQQKMILPIRDYSRFWSEADIELKCPQAVAAFAEEVRLMQAEGAQAVPGKVQAWRLGRFGLVGLPGMPFVEFALSIKRESPFATTVVAGNAGGYVGPVVPQEAFDRAGYETWPARSACIGPGGGEFAAAEAVSLLRRLACG